MNTIQTGSKSKKKKMIKEFSMRTGDYNTGGSSRRKLMTAYREKTLRFAALIAQYESITVKELREILKDTAVAPILQKNYYGWFQRVRRGTYCLTASGHSALEEYRHILQITR